jgi:4-amino-4-deoxy-L-arabinose transferase-like glycosyltransferase
MIHDEGGYAYATRGWLDGTGQLYDDLWISRPQGIFMLYGVVFTFLGESVWALRFTAWAFAAGTVFAIWLFARRWTTPRTANLAAIVGAVILALPNIEGFTANAEIFMGLPLAFVAFMLVRQAQSQWSLPQLFSAGVLIGIGTLLKPSGIVMLFTALAFILMVAPGPRKHRLRLCADLVAGVTVVGILALVHGWFLGWDDFIYATVTYRLTLQSSATVSLMHHLDAFGGMIGNTLALVLLVIFVVTFRIILPVRVNGPRRNRRPGTWGPGNHLISHLRHHRQLAPRETAGLMIQLWSIGAIAGIAMGGDWWPHYLIQIVPPLALWLAWNLESIARALRSWRRALFIAIATGLLLLPYAIIIDGPEGMVARLYGHPGYPAQAEVARYIQDHTHPDDTIYVAFDQAAIYYLSDRKPAYRHLYDQELQALPNSYADIIAIIRSEDRPVYIVSTLHPGPFADDSRAFWREVGQYYDIETTIDGVPIYRAKDPSSGS